MLRREPCQTLLLFIELALVIVTVCVLAHGRASGLRTALWTAGGERGWNSTPRLLIYFYAKHKQPPDVPPVWTEDLGDSLLGIAILNAAIWATRLAMFHSNIDAPWVGAVYDLLLSGLWMYGVNAQSSSDLTDTHHLSPQPWYLSRNCAEVSGRDGVLCGQGRASFAVAVVALIFYFVRSIWSVLRLAYWCGEYGVLDRCADRIGEHCVEPQWKRKAEEDRVVEKRQLLKKEARSLCKTCIEVRNE